MILSFHKTRPKIKGCSMPIQNTCQPDISTAATLDGARRGHPCKGDRLVAQEHCHSKHARTRAEKVQKAQ